MNYLSQLLILISALTLWMPAWARSSDISGPTPLVLSDSQSEYALGQHLEILEDPAGNLTIQDVSSSEYSDRFVPSQVDSPNYGYTDSVYWVRFRLRNESRTTNHWLLELKFPNIHYVDLYLPSQEGEGYITRQTGVLRPFNTRDITNHHIVFDLPVPPGKDLTFYMRFQSGASMTLPLTLWLPDAFFQDSANELLFLGIFYGAMLIMLVYNLFLLYSLREASNLYYVCFLASGILMLASYDALADQYLWPDLYAFNRFSIPLFFILFMASTTKFTDTFLEISSRKPNFHRVLMVVLAGWGIALLLLPFVSYRLILSLIVPFGVMCFGMIAVAGFISWRSGYIPARYFSVAWVGLVFSGSVVLLVRLDILLSTPLTEQSFRLGLLWLVALWAFALSDRINVLRAEKENAALEKQASEARYRKLVETMNDGLGVIDENGRFTYANDRLTQMLGYPPDELLGHEVEEFVDEENLHILAGQLAKRKTGVTAPYELTWRRQDGSELFTVVSPMALFEESGQFKGAFAVVTDITERVQAGRLLEQRVSERTRELSTLLDISREITTTRSMDYLLNRILERLKTIVDYRNSAVLVIEKGYWRIKACLPANLEKTEDLLPSSEEARALVQAFKSGEAVILNCSPGDDSQTNNMQAMATLLLQILHADACTWLAIPLLTKESLIGGLFLSYTGQIGFSEDQVKVAAAFANQIAIVIENNQLLDQAQAAVAAEERSRIARELHDSVTQTLFTASVMAEATPRIWNKDPGVARQNMEKLSMLIRGALAEMRSLLFELRSSESMDQSLDQLLNTLVEVTRSRGNLIASVDIMGDREPPQEVAMAFYRIAREALNNVILHAEATRVEIALIKSQGRVELSIRDDGRSFDSGATPAGHLGISIMTERAQKIGADFQIRSQVGQGTEVRVTWLDSKGGSSHD